MPDVSERFKSLYGAIVAALAGDQIIFKHRNIEGFFSWYALPASEAGPNKLETLSYCGVGDSPEEALEDLAAELGIVLEQPEPAIQDIGEGRR